ncbi:MAG: carboxypeptidase regulatory-like domain-containing protein [Candidatus Bathyarchaeia archaeon]
MKANGKGLAALLMLIASLFALLNVNLNLYPYLTKTISAENYLAGIIDARPDETALIGWGNIESRHNVFTNNPIQRVLVKRPPLDIPAGSTITKAILRLYTKDYNKDYCTDTAKRTYCAHKILQDWNPNTLTWRNQPSFASTPTAKIQKSPKTDVNQWWEFDVTPDINSPYGWVIKDETEDAYGFFAWNYIVFIDTAELYIEYTLPKYTLTVSVKDSDGKPLSDVKVTAPFTATTDSNGQASSSLDYGSYTVTISYLGYTYTQNVKLDSTKTVSFTIPNYQLTIKVVDTANNPISGVGVGAPIYKTTDTQGTCSAKLPKGKYTIEATYGTKKTSVSIDLTSDRTVSITIPLEYTLNIRVRDQCGNPLPATLTIDGQTLVCGKDGTASLSILPGTKNIKASVTVKEKEFSTTGTTTVTKHTTVDLVINRRFYWVFYFNYSDGTVPEKGSITLTHPKEVLKVPLTNGVGEAYLLDGIYRITVEASPAVDLGTIEVNSDGKIFYTLNKQKAQLEQKEEKEIKQEDEDYPIITPPTPPPQPTPPEIPWILIPSVYIYTLVAVLAFGFILAAAVALRRRR